MIGHLLTGRQQPGDVALVAGRTTLRLPRTLCAGIAVAGALPRKSGRGFVRPLTITFDAEATDAHHDPRLAVTDVIVGHCLSMKRATRRRWRYARCGESSRPNFARQAGQWTMCVGRGSRSSGSSIPATGVGSGVCQCALLVDRHRDLQDLRELLVREREELAHGHQLGSSSPIGVLIRIVAHGRRSSTQSCIVGGEVSASTPKRMGPGITLEQ
jgi:hypothetical protein